MNPGLFYEQSLEPHGSPYINTYKLYTLCFLVSSLNGSRDLYINLFYISYFVNWMIISTLRYQYGKDWWDGSASKMLALQFEDLGSDVPHLRRRPAIACICNHCFGERRRKQRQETHWPSVNYRFETLSQNIRWTAIEEDSKWLLSWLLHACDTCAPRMNMHLILSHTNYERDSHTSVYSLQGYNSLSYLCIFIFVFSYIYIILKWHLGREQVRHKGCVTGEEAIA